MDWIVEKIKELFSGEWILDTLYEMFGNLFSRVIYGMCSGILMMLNTVYESLMDLAMTIIDREAVIASIARYVMYGSLLLLIALGTKQLLINHISGEMEGASLKQFLVRTVMAVIGIVYAKEVVSMVLYFSKLVTNDFGKVLSGYTIGQALNSDPDAMLTGYERLFNVSVGGFSVIGALLLLVSLIVLLVSYIQIAIRTAELCLIVMLSPFFAVDIINPSRSMWSYWVKYVITICMTFAIQWLMISMTIYFISMTAFTYTAPIYGFIAFGWAIITVKTPGFIKQFITPSGVGSMVNSMGSAAAGALR